MTTLTRPRPETAGPETPAGPENADRRRRDADGMAVASFVSGLVGLLVFNLVLGPLAVVLAGIAVLRGTDRRGRALLGASLGAADLIVLSFLVTVDGTVSWSLAG